MKSRMTIAIIGAGGKMGMRIISNLQKHPYRLMCSEKSKDGHKRLKQKGLEPVDSVEAVPQVDLVILAVPDRLIKKISEDLVPLMKPHASLLLLDPAAAYIDELALRDDCTFVATHPCHPALFSVQETQEAREDFFGGIAAKQDIVIALIQGTEKNFKRTEKICREIFAPVVNCHRITVEQMAILEPAAAEVVAASAAVLMKQATDEAIRQGVPEAAAKAFMLGHAQIPLAIAFGKVSNPFSDAAQVAIKVGFERVIRKEWREVFNRDFLKKTVYRMLHPEANE